MRILVFGDSNSWGYDASAYDVKTGIAKRMAADVRWPGRMQRRSAPRSSSSKTASTAAP